MGVTNYLLTGMVLQVAGDIWAYLTNIWAYGVLSDCFKTFLVDLVFKLLSNSQRNKVLITSTVSWKKTREESSVP